MRYNHQNKLKNIDVMLYHCNNDLQEEEVGMSTHRLQALQELKLRECCRCRRRPQAALRPMMTMRMLPLVLLMLHLLLHLLLLHLLLLHLLLLHLLLLLLREICGVLHKG